MPRTTIKPAAFPKRGNWTPEQLKLAFYLYCQLPFGKLHQRNPQIVELSKLIGRTPSSLAMKLVNFASLDPTIRDSGRHGLGNASALDKTVWNEFHADWDRLVAECQQIRESLAHEQGQRIETPQEVDGEFALSDFTGETRRAIVAQRVKQSFFRRAVLASYRGRCCISGVSDSRFLVASHIVAWNEDAIIRLHPGNGLCLSAIHDRAFDRHLFSLTDDHHIILSSHLRKTPDAFLRQVFGPVDGKKISLPEKFVPEQAFIERHREKMRQLEK